MLNTTGRFHLYSDTSKFAARSVLYQIQNGKHKLIVYASKRLPEAAKNYSITELELCRLAINIASFSHLLKRVDFDAIVDHLSLTHIIKGKAEPATIRIKRLLVLHENYYNMENYLVQTRSQTKPSAIKLPEVHGVGKNLDSNIKPENNLPIP